MKNLINQVRQQSSSVSPPKQQVLQEENNRASNLSKRSFDRDIREEDNEDDALSQGNERLYRQRKAGLRVVSSQSRDVRKGIKEERKIDQLKKRGRVLEFMN